MFLKLNFCQTDNNQDIIESNPDTEAIIRRCFVKNVFLKFLQNSKENTCSRVSFFKKFAGDF